MAWLLSIVIRFALSRRREYLADAGAVELTKNPDAMISALRKIEGRGELEGATSAVMEMCVDNPREGFADLFATHPSIESRIEALIEFAGGHDPGPLDLPPPGEQTGEAQQQDPPESKAMPATAAEPPKPFLPVAAAGRARRRHAAGQPDPPVRRRLERPAPQAERRHVQCRCAGYSEDIRQRQTNRPSRFATLLRHRYR